MSFGSTQAKSGPIGRLGAPDPAEGLVIDGLSHLKHYPFQVTKKYADMAQNMDGEGRKLTIKTICNTEQSNEGFLDSLARAFQNNDGFFIHVEEDGTVSRYEFSFHDDVLEIEHLANRVEDLVSPGTVGTVLEPFEPMVFLVETENDCTVLKQMNFNKMACDEPEMGNGKKDDRDSSSEHPSGSVMSLEELSKMHDAPQTGIPMIDVGGNDANAVSVDQLASLLRQTAQATPTNGVGGGPIIVLDEDNMPKGDVLPLKKLPGTPKSKAAKFGSSDILSCLQGKNAQDISSRGGHPSQLSDVDSDAENSLREASSSRHENTGSWSSEDMPEQAILQSIVAKASSPQNKGVPIETESIGKIMAKHDERYAKELMKKKLAEQNAISNRSKKHMSPESDSKSTLVADGHPHDKSALASLPSTDEKEDEANKSLVTLPNVEPKRKRMEHPCPKVEYCKSAEVDSVVIKITVPENSGIEVVLHKVNDEADSDRGGAEERGSATDKVACEETGDGIQSETLKHMIESASPHCKTISQASAEGSAPPGTTKSPSPKNRIISSINERKLDLERNTRKGKVKKMVEYFESINELE